MAPRGRQQDSGNSPKQLKPGNGILFTEQDVRSETQPEMTGRLHVNCPACGAHTMQRLAGWWHQSRNKEYLKVTHSDFLQKEQDDRDQRGRGGPSRGRGRGRPPRRDDNQYDDQDTHASPPPFMPGDDADVGGRW